MVLPLRSSMQYNDLWLVRRDDCPRNQATDGAVPTGQIPRGGQQGPEDPAAGGHVQEGRHRGDQSRGCGATPSPVDPLAVGTTSRK
eukprot:2971193-Pyramimonas_sp.AAC.1